MNCSIIEGYFKEVSQGAGKMANPLADLSEDLMSLTHSTHMLAHNHL